MLATAMESCKRLNVKFSVKVRVRKLPEEISFFREEWEKNLEKKVFLPVSSGKKVEKLEETRVVRVHANKVLKRSSHTVK